MMLSKPIQYFSERLRRVFRGAMWLTLALTLGTSLPAAASSSPPLPVVTVGIADTFGNSMMYFDLSIPQVLNQPYYVSGQVVLTFPFPNSQYAAGADIYFGVIMPGGTTVYTWSPNSSGSVTLSSGYAPIVRARSMLTPGTFNTSSVNAGSPIKYTFSGTEPKGLYLLFTFLVPTGTDPTNIQQWFSTTMQPLFLK